MKKLQIKKKEIQDIITLNIDGWVLEDEEFRKSINDTIHKKRDTTKTDTFQLPMIGIKKSKMFDGIELYTISINKNTSSIYQYKNIEDTVDKLYKYIMINKIEVLKLMKKYKDDDI